MVTSLYFHVMRLITLLVSLCLATTYCLANEIDKLQSTNQVTTFLRTRVSKEWKEEVFFEPSHPDTAAYGKGKFFKLDLDANGLTDLVVNGKYLFVVTDEGNAKYVSHFIDRGAFTLQTYKLLTIIPQTRVPLLVVLHAPAFRRRDAEPATLKPDTILLKFGGFIEYQHVPTKTQISQINLSTSGCFGTCPIFELTIQPNRAARYHAIQYNKRKGTFTAIIDTATYSKLVATIQYINLPALQDAYRVNWTDDQTVDLTVTFSDGQVKKIHDYGAIGTFGLANLYEQLYRLRETQAWK